MKKAFIIGFILILIAVLLFIILGRNNRAETKYITAVIQKGNIVITVTATGSLEAVTTVQVGSQISGTIAALYADFNDQVKKGQILAQLDPTFLKAQVAQAEADLEKATASAELSRTQYERSLTLFEGNMISESDRDAALATYRQAQADVKSSKANLDRIKTNLNYATITSPIDGVVISRNVDVGQTVAASLQAPTLFTIAQDLTKMQVKTSIDEADISRIKDGQDAIFTVDAYPEQKFEGIVKQIRLAPEVVQNVVSYDVILEVSNPDMLLKPGMTANVTIEIDRQDDILKVASAALRYHPVGDKTGSSTWRRGSTDKADNPGAADSMISSRHEPSSDRPANGRRLWILDPQGKPEPIPVQIGISDGVFTQVISDKLKEGDKVITGVEGVTPATNSQVNPFAPRFPGGRR